MTREEVGQGFTNLAGAILPVLRRMRPNAPDDSAGLLQDLDAVSNAYHAALRAGMQLAHEQAANEGGQTLPNGYPHGVGENGK